VTKTLLQRLDAAYTKSPDPDAIQKSLLAKGWRKGHNLSQREWDELREGTIVIGYFWNDIFLLCSSGQEKPGHFTPRNTQSWYAANDALNSSHWVIPAEEYFEGSQP
jgi:hypothetical protein